MYVIDIQGYLFTNLLRLLANRRRNWLGYDIEAREEEKRKAKEEARQQSSGATEYIQNLLASYPQSVRQALGNNIWTQIGNNPLKFIVGEKRHNHVCRAEAKTMTSGSMSLHNLSYGTIIFKCIPTTIIYHENPFDFLSSPMTYLCLVFFCCRLGAEH
jgi:hypothetical protein